MAGLFDKQAEMYLDGRPNYPPEWFSMLSSLTLRHSLAWDVGTGNGQAAVAVAEHYEQVIGTDISEPQLRHAIQNPKVRYLHTPPALSEDDIISAIGGENSVDLITVAAAVHWFDIPSFYSTAIRLLRKPGGVIAVWSYKKIEVSPTVDAMLKKFYDTVRPFWHPRVEYAFDEYKTLPFPFESVGLGSEGEPLRLDIPKELSFEGFIMMLGSLSAVITAKDQGVDLLSNKVVEEFERAWGGRGLVRSMVYKAFMLVGKVRA